MPFKWAQSRRHSVQNRGRDRARPGRDHPGCDEIYERRSDPRKRFDTLPARIGPRFGASGSGFRGNGRPVACGLHARDCGYRGRRWFGFGFGAWGLGRKGRRREGRRARGQKKPGGIPSRHARGGASISKKQWVIPSLHARSAPVSRETMGHPERSEGPPLSLRCKAEARAPFACSLHARDCGCRGRRGFGFGAWARRAEARRREGHRSPCAEPGPGKNAPF
jgi:hypothetical protein